MNGGVAIARLTLVLFLLLVLPLAAQANVESHCSCVCPPELQRICDAGAKRDPAEKEEALEGAYGDFLCSKDPDLRQGALRLLEREVRFGFDPRPLRRFLECFDSMERAARKAKVDPEDESPPADEVFEGAEVIDRADLRAASPSVRAEVYRKALRTGEAKFGKALSITARTAASLAAQEGLADLRDLVAKEAGSSPDRISLVAVLDLRGGASSSDDAPGRAVDRLSRMGVSQILDRLVDIGFRQAVAETNLEVCLERESANCQKMRSIVDRLFEERARQFQEATDSLGITRPTRPEELEDLRTWAETRDKKVRAAFPRFAALADLTSRLGFPTDNRCCW